MNKTEKLQRLAQLTAEYEEALRASRRVYAKSKARTTERTNFNRDNMYHAQQAAKLRTQIAVLRATRVED